MGQLFYRNGLMVCAALQALGGRAPTWFSRWCWQRLSPWLPNRGVRFNAYNIVQSERGEIRAKLCALSITRIGQYDSSGNLSLYRLPYLLQSNLGLSLKCNSFRNAGLSAALDVLAPHFRQV